jgi:hypothetical protein
MSSRKYKSMGKGKPFNKNPSRQQISTIHIRVKTSTLAQYTSGVGALSAGSSVTSYICDPYQVGGRFGQLAAFWQRYRVKSGTLKYAPFGSGAGYVSDVTGGTASATAIIAERDFACIFLPDPDVSLTTSDQILDSGGKVGNSSKPMSFRIPPTGWLWTSTDTAAAAPPTGADYRMACFGRHAACFTATSTTAARTYGQFVFDLIVEFKHEHTQVSVIGITLRDESKKQFHSPTISPFEIDDIKDPETLDTTLTRSFVPAIRRKETLMPRRT